MLRISLKYAIPCLFVLSMAQVDVFGMDRKNLSGNYPKIKDMGEFTKNNLLGDDEWEGIAPKIIKIFTGEDADRVLRGEGSRIFRPDDWVLSWVIDSDGSEGKSLKQEESRRKIAGREKTEKLDAGSFKKAFKKWLKTVNAHKLNGPVVMEFCKKNDIKYMGGNAQYIFLLESEDCACIVYSPRFYFGSIENSFDPWNYVMMSRVLTFNLYKHFSKKYGLDRFRVREFKILPYNKEKDLCAVTDEDCFLVAKFFENNSFENIDSEGGKKTLGNLWRGFLEGDAECAKTVRDMLLGLRWCAIWTIGHGNVVLMREGDKVFVCALDGKAPGIGGNDKHYRDENGRPRVGSLSRYPDEKKTQRLGRIGIEQVFQLLFNGKIGKGSEDVNNAVTKAMNFAEADDPTVESCVSTFVK